MAKIKYVATCADPEPGGFGTMLDIHFDNGQILLLSIKSKQEDSAFVKLYQRGELNRPKTDGDSVYWEDGTRLSIPEMIKMVRGI